MTSPAPSPTVPGRGWRRLRLGTVGGVPVLLSPSWVLVAGLVTLLLTPVAGRATGLGQGAAAAVALGMALLLALSVLLHEAGHALAARAFGLHVEEVVVDLWGGHTSLGRPGTPWASAVVSVVGPLVNLAVAALALLARLVVPPGAPATAAAVVAFLLSALAVTNLLLGLFNLVPGLPLDGGRVLEALVWRVSGSQDTGTVVAAWAGRLAVLGLAAWLLGGPLLEGRRPSTITLVWVALLAWFLWRGAGASLQVARFRRRAARVDLAAVSRPVRLLPDHARVADVAGAASGPAADAVLVDGAGRPVAVVPGGSVAAVPADQWPTTPAAAIAVALPATAVVPARLGPMGAVEALARSGSVGVVLTDEVGRPVARVLPDDFAAAMGLR